jgi:quercetin dioxygenase-like cupin family protein
MNIKDFKNGWIVGNFEPSLFFCEQLDIGVLYLKSGQRGDGHFHKNHTEYNIIIEGKAKINDKILNAGDIFIYHKLEKSNVEYLEDTILLVIKNPSTKNDKYY